MNRRAFLHRWAAASVLTAGRQVGKAADARGSQDTLPSGRPAVLPPGQADRLYDPSVVQERAATTAADNDPAIKELEHRLKCTCGCNLDIYTCRTTDFTCTYSPSLHQEVVALRKAGKNDDAVIEAFIAKYGESILMAPRPRGFNLAGYLVPGILVATVALVLAWVLIRRSRLTPAPARPQSPRAVESLTPGENERLKQALQEIED